MGGRGSAGRGGGLSTKSGITSNTKFTSTQLKKMPRSKLEIAARAVFIKQHTARGLSAKEADYRARSLMSGNSDAQLRRYIKKYG